MRRGFSHAAPRWRAFIDGGAPSLAISAEIEDASAVFDAARLRRGVHALSPVDLVGCAPFGGNLSRRRGCIGVTPPFVAWGGPPTKAGSSPAVELQ